MRKKIAVVGMLFMTCLSSVGCGQKKDKQESSTATKTSTFEDKQHPTSQTEKTTKGSKLKKTSKENKNIKQAFRKDTESKTQRYKDSSFSI